MEFLWPRFPTPASASAPTIGLISSTVFGEPTERAHAGEREPVWDCRSQNGSWICTEAESRCKANRAKDRSLRSGCRWKRTPARTTAFDQLTPQRNVPRHLLQITFQFGF